LRVNELFAKRLMPLLQDDDVVWVHDYHLIPMGEALRRNGFTGRLGFFLHTPLPTYEVLVALPNHRDLMRALCAYDLVGVQTERDMAAFRAYIEQEAGGTVTADGRVQAYDRELTARAYPISCDTQNVARMAETSAHGQQTLRMIESMGGRNLIIGVDRLDYSKGLARRFQAFERLLESYPDNRSWATLLQLAPPTRSDVPEYAEIRRELEESAGHINGRFAEIDWVPIRYLNKSLNRRTLAGFFRAANVGLVTPLRDGMNLVAKEYLAAQDPHDPGVLVLSRFAGAAEQLDQALIVNPYDIDEVAEAMQRALTMPLDERKARWQASFDHLSAHDVVAWREAFLNELAGTAAFQETGPDRLSA
jgi:trehalose 6-phosphate synthase